MQHPTHIFYRFIVKPFLKLYLKSDSHVKFDGFNLKVFKEVFHPKLFFSTRYFYEFIKKLELSSLRFLEIGSGSGILSLLAYKKGAKVTAIDIDIKAVENTKLNFLRNTAEADAQILQSDLFTCLTPQGFDVIVINPPYYFKKIEVDPHYAWYCGEEGEYFEKLFAELRNYIHNKSSVYMILEEKCEIDRIKNIALKNKFSFELEDQRQIKFEKSYIFKIVPSGRIS